MDKKDHFPGNEKAVRQFFRLFLFLILLIAFFIQNPPAKASAATSAELIHQFDFDGNLNDSLPTGVQLEVHPNTFSSAFGIKEWSWTANSAPGGGLILNTDLITNPENYSLGFRISYQQVSPGWKKIISFKGPTVDNGLYFYNSNLEFYPFGPNTEITYTTNTFYDFIFTRSSDDVIRVYIVEENGDVTKVYEKDDPGNDTVPITIDSKYEFFFFMDDIATSAEYTTGGTVRTIRVWNGVLDLEDIGDALSDVRTDPATNVTTNSAVLNGSVNPFGVETDVFFDFGLTSAYGSRTEAAQSPLTESAVISKSINGLTSGTPYFYRAVAVNPNTNEETYGAERTFTTLDTPPSSPSTIPQTGFPAGQKTELPAQSQQKAYQKTDLILNIPVLNKSIPIIGVPIIDGNWDVTWLSDKAGYLEGTAYPTLPGNTVITAHVWDAFNHPGPFYQLNTLKFGDEIKIFENNLIFTYEVRENRLVNPKNIKAIIKEEDLDWVTLVTCEQFDQQNNNYESRRIVRAVLVSVY